MLSSKSLFNERMLMFKFKVGDRVVCMDNSGCEDRLEQGEIYRVGNVSEGLLGGEVIVVCEFGYAYSASRFKLAQAHTQYIATTPTQMLLSKDANERKATPITTGVLDYFPLAIAAVAVCSKAGNDQHHPNTPLAWDKTKSTDHADCIARHLIDRSSYDTDGVLHAAKLAWRALALLQIELEKGAKAKCQGKDCNGNEWNN
jgi:hypothetical protein